MLINNLYEVDQEQTFISLANSMGYRKPIDTDPGGTNRYDAYLGMFTYIQNNNLAQPSGSEYMGDKNSFDWSIITANINSGNPLYISVPTNEYKPGEKGNHGMLVVGYESTGVNDFLRVADGWNHSLSNFFNYKWTNVNALWYVKW